MVEKQVLQEKVYEPIKNLKNKFYQTKTQEEWDNCKVELKELLELAKPMMDSEFYEKYKKGVVDSIAKTYTYKEKYFKKSKFTPQPKVTYLLQDELAQALTEYVKVLTKIKQKELDNFSK